VQTEIQKFRDECRKKMPAACESVFFFGGQLSIAFGSWMAWHPLGPIVAGVMAVWLSLLISAERSVPPAKK